jgi:hypothetical protein
MCFQRLSFGDFSLARQRKVTAPPGAYPGAVSRRQNKQQRKAKAQEDATVGTCAKQRR